MKVEDLKLPESVALESIVLDRIRFGINKPVYPLDLKYHKQEDYMTGAMMHMLSWSLLGKNIDTHTCPRTWWDGFKHKHFPKWLKKRYPPVFDTIKLYNVCPHINIEFPKNQAIHLNWTMEDHGFTPTEAKTAEEILNDIIEAYNYSKERAYNNLDGFGMGVFTILALNNLIEVGKK